MHQITTQDAAAVAGSGFFLNYAAGRALTWVCNEVLSGHVDYSSIAEQQGSYYNSVGA